MPGSTRSFEFAKRLASAGHEVTMITSSRDTTNEINSKIEIIDNFRVHWIPVSYSNSMSFQRRILSFLIYMLRASFVASKYKADLVFASSTPLTVIIPAYISGKIRRAPVIFEVRDLWPEVPIGLGYLKGKVKIYFAKRLERFAYYKSDHLIALSEDMKNGILNEGISAEKVSVIPNSADIQSFRPLSKKGYFSRFGIKDETKVFVYAGTFGKVNEVDYLVDLANQFKFDDRIYFLAIGFGSEFERVKSYAKTIGVYRQRLSFSEALPKQDIYELLSRADMVCSLTQDNKVLEWNSANKFFDGLASGCATFTNYGGWQQEELVKHKAGCRLSRNILEAKKQIIYYLENSDKLEEAKINARLLAERKYSRDLLYNDLAEVISNVTNTSGKGPE